MGGASSSRCRASRTSRRRTFVSLPRWHRISRALQLTQRLARAEIARAAPVELLNRLEQGVVLVDGQAQVLFVNRAAESAFDGGGLRLRGPMLRTDSIDETAARHAPIAACARAGAGDKAAMAELLRLASLRHGARRF